MEYDKKSDLDIETDKSKFLKVSMNHSNNSQNLLFNNSVLSKPVPETASLFTSPQIANASPNMHSLFSAQTLASLNAQSFMKSKDEEEENSEDDEEFKGSESPNPYNPNENKSKSIYKKKYIKQVDNIYVFNKEQGKFVSKGSGFLSLEYTDVGKKTGLLLFR
jgi:hypothetical protein